MEKVQKMASSTKGRASRAPFAGHFLYFFHTFCNFSEKLALDVFYPIFHEKKAPAAHFPEQKLVKTLLFFNLFSNFS